VAPSPQSPLCFRLCLVSRCRNVSTTSSPVDVDILVLGVLLVGKFWLDLEGVSTEVISLSLKEVSRKVLGTVSVEPAQGSAESRGWYAEKCCLGDDLSPAGLSLVDGLVEEVIEQQVLEIWVVAVR
jgi:hypothetical protein